MLVLPIKETEFYDEKSNQFIYIKARDLRLEHSLISIYKWESIWQKPFLSEVKTYEQSIDYIRCMTLDTDVDPNVYKCLKASDIKIIEKYISSPMTATWFSDSGKNKKSNEVVTAEIIYYWMISLGIPFECQKWHLNKLLTLIKVVSLKNAPTQKMSKKDILNQNRALNAARRAKMNSKG